MEWVSCTMSSERVEKVRTSWLTFAFNVKRGLIKEPPILARRGGGFINPGLTLAAVFLPKSDTKSKKCKEIYNPIQKVFGRSQGSKTKCYLETLHKYQNDYQRTREGIHILQIEFQYHVRTL